eukprot:365198-Chlamydomonas_euryale.AAC.13
MPRPLGVSAPCRVGQTCTHACTNRAGAWGCRAGRMETGCVNGGGVHRCQLRPQGRCPGIPYAERGQTLDKRFTTPALSFPHTFPFPTLVLGIQMKQQQLILRTLSRK